MSAIPVIAVFDIGKTNKKCFLFDEHYRIVLERSQSFAEIVDEDGDACEDLQLLADWVQQVFDEVNALPQYLIQAVNFSAYGASFVHIDEAGNPVTPLYNYLKPYPQELQNAFYKKYGGEDKLSLETASPVLGNLNSGLQLYRLKEQQPAVFKKISYSLHLPQYLGFLFTQQPASDITSIGCHTSLWHFGKKRYHSWVTLEGVVSKLAPVVPHSEAFMMEKNKRRIKAGIGLHDSSAALIPYLSVFNDPFLLISTGTWCISLNPFNDTPLTSSELKMDCLCYLAYNGRPVKASRLFAGYEHELQVRKLAEHFKVNVDVYKSVEFDHSWLTVTGKKLFSGDDLSVFENYSEAYHALMQSIIDKQCVSSLLVMGNVKRIFVDGGFANNPVYLHLLADAFPRHEVFAASVSQATAVGAALVMHDQWNPQPVPGDLVSLKFYSVRQR
ncbi:FGGY-family carbohydrate kinase [Sediminibacterium soli]|uniref:FGGY-family carbohydrate kinase n=1 Tax=Sediminibacterium soli TaxID=2698829 RepID=UPI001379C93D|nr:FGGY family carbohydrate kinase [Sediminibacterium soli]NCI46860.1 carbohydrate kinase [Sediminibacterium soli]